MEDKILKRKLLTSINNRKIKEQKKKIMIKDPLVTLLYTENMQSILSF